MNVISVGSGTVVCEKTKYGKCSNNCLGVKTRNCTCRLYMDDGTTLRTVQEGPENRVCSITKKCESPLVNFAWYRTSTTEMGGGPRVVVSTAASHARVRGSVPGRGGLKETKMFLPHPHVKLSIVGASVTER